MLFPNAQAVNYPTEYPEILTENLYTRETVEKVLLTKAKCWEYESEFRLLGSPDLPEGNPLRLHEGYLKLPPLALMSVIVGCKGDYQAVQMIVDAEAPDLRVTKLIRSTDQYSLAMAVVPDHQKNKRFKIMATLRCDTDSRRPRLIWFRSDASIGRGLKSSHMPRPRQRQIILGLIVGTSLRAGFITYQ